MSDLPTIIPKTTQFENLAETYKVFCKQEISKENEILEQIRNNFKSSTQ